jgi:biopolymer transport protein ExbD
MRIPARRRKASLGFNLTPMIDVVFNLIIFFLVASHFSHVQSDIPVALPKATQGSSGDDDPNRLTITVTSEGRWSVAGRPVSLTDIETMIKEGADSAPGVFSVHIRGDQSARYEVIEPLLLACARNHVTSVRFNVLQP